jgi:hypothetical protein
MSGEERLFERFREVARVATEEIRPTCSIHSHAGGSVDFEEASFDTSRYRRMTFAGIDPPETSPSTMRKEFHFT